MVLGPTFQEPPRKHMDHLPLLIIIDIGLEYLVLLVMFIVSLFRPSYLTTMVLVDDILEMVVLQLVLILPIVLMLSEKMELGDCISTTLMEVLVLR